MLVAAVLLGACGTTVELSVPESDFEAVSAQAAHEQSIGDDASGPTPSPEPTPTPADLPYEEAIDVYFVDVERFWADAMPPTFGLDFEPVDRRVPYEPERPVSVPACGGEVGPQELYADNAYYCAPDDYIAWDDNGLFPDLYRTYGDFSVGLVIAHEYGHAVQFRAAVDGPTIFVELQADCFAGAWAGDVAASGSVPFQRSDLDAAIGGFLTFADPLGTPAGDPGAHGTAFDRLNAFAEGFDGGVDVCVDYLSTPPQTATILVDPADTSGGNLPLDELIPLLVEDLSLSLDTLSDIGPQAAYVVPGPPVDFGGSAGAPGPCGGVAPSVEEIEAAAYYCAETNQVFIDRGELDAVWREVGDFAPAYAVAHSYAMSLAVEYTDTDSGAAVLAADCLVGVWARDVFDEAAAAPVEPFHVLYLSAGDLDEGIVGFLLLEVLGPDLSQVDDVGTFDRVAEFGRGFFRGVSQCPVTG